MTIGTYPDTIVIGRVVMHTRNRFLARVIERHVQDEAVPAGITSGTLSIDGERVVWVLLPDIAPKNSPRL